MTAETLRDALAAAEADTLADTLRDALAEAEGANAAPWAVGPSAIGSDPAHAHGRSAALGSTAARLDELLAAVAAGDLAADVIAHAYVLGARDALRAAVEQLDRTEAGA